MSQRINMCHCHFWPKRHNFRPVKLKFSDLFLLLQKIQIIPTTFWNKISGYLAPENANSAIVHQIPPSTKTMVCS